ncbi:hypothetical protein GGU11DRAFT_771224 [Lentinula aff. detonsa]|nr:hypothetical protein GGU11DRAFT_771224 [Lentinula aff. detonsa]
MSLLLNVFLISSICFPLTSGTVIRCMYCSQDMVGGVWKISAFEGLKSPIHGKCKALYHYVLRKENFNFPQSHEKRSINSPSTGPPDPCEHEHGNMSISSMQCPKAL